MSPRIYFSITQEELEILNAEVLSGGFANVSDLAKSRTLQTRNTITNNYQVMLAAIDKLEPETVFFLRDVVSAPQALLGRWLYDNVKSNSIPNVRHLPKTGSDAERYIKGWDSKSLEKLKDKIIEILKNEEAIGIYKYRINAELIETEAKQLQKLFDSDERNEIEIEKVAGAWKAKVKKIIKSE
jgi:hypothetical protein